MIFEVRIFVIFVFGGMPYFGYYRYCFGHVHLICVCSYAILDLILSFPRKNSSKVSLPSKPLLDVINSTLVALVTISDCILDAQAGGGSILHHILPKIQSLIQR